ncbi:hypothetical protein FSP39_011277 [Pinctada imbricata]|uniref:Uncharacterized protein n=1 Tax=Pinctada imbricata TaxID=66713 RepID=A0AA88YLG4_PINIB|nr:hypothetical protein FSP39_011277 [Pinctada imbricata]
MVFDSSTRYKGVSLNEVIMNGQDITNNLQGILLRFRREHIAMSGDVEQMFHQFRVHEPHRNYLRFLWHPQNDLEEPLQEYRMTVHVFGNRPSPAVATYGIRRSVSDADLDVRDFVCRNFYVDDGLISCASVPKAVDLMKRTQLDLMEGGQLRLHKIASNSKEFLCQFDKNDLAKDLKNLDIGEDNLPVQRSLGLSWDIEQDTFIFRLLSDPKPFTRRGVLSTINSLFDPIGFTAPVTLEGKLLLKEMMTTGYSPDWDTPLPKDFQGQWEVWVNSLHHLHYLNIPRMYCNMSVKEAESLEVHVFSDASKHAIAAVAYIRVFTKSKVDVGFLLGKAKVAPSNGHALPRLELCASLLAIEIAEVIKEHMDFTTGMFHFYTDSKVSLGYISNETRRFHVYVSNRVSRIRAFCCPEQWNGTFLDTIFILFGHITLFRLRITDEGLVPETCMSGPCCKFIRS